MDGRAWWATVHKVAKSWTQLKQLSTHKCIQKTYMSLKFCFSPVNISKSQTSKKNRRVEERYFCSWEQILVNKHLIGHKEIVSYKLALAKSICQWPNSNKGVCHLPLQRLNTVLLQLLTFNTSWGEFRGESEAALSRKLVKQVVR